VQGTTDQIILYILLSLFLRIVQLTWSKTIKRQKSRATMAKVTSEDQS